jgi:hypothetical protein
MRGLLVDSAGLNCVLGQLQLTADSTNSQHDIPRSLGARDVSKECEYLLISVKQSLEKCEQISGNDAKNFGHRLIWPSKERETKVQRNVSPVFGFTFSST